MAKPGRTLDNKQTNRRQKHEIDTRAKRWRCSKLAVILADMLEAECPGTAAAHIALAKIELRRSNRAARKAGK